MTWLFPGFLAGAALIGLPVVLHLLRRKPRKIIRFPSLRFLGEAAVRETRQSQLRRWLTLLLRCLAILLVCGAFARPFWGATPKAGRQAVVIALDNSMSEQASGRWPETQRWAARQLDTLQTGDQAALLIMEPEPYWQVRMTEDIAQVRGALMAAKPGYDRTRYARPLRIAGEALANATATTKTLIWAADEQRAGWRGTDLAQTLPSGEHFQFHEAMAAPQRQAAIIEAHRLENGTNGVQAVIRQFGSSGGWRTLTVSAGQRVLAKQDVSLHEGDNEISVACSWPPAAPGLRVALDPDDLPGDDSAWIATSAATTNAVQMDATQGTDFLGHALRATQKIAGGACSATPLPDHAWRSDLPVILRSETSFRTPAVERLNQFCESGGAAWIFLDGSAGQREWLKQHGVRVTERASTSEPWHLRDWDAGHPALTAFSRQNLLPLLEVEFYRGFNLTGDTLAPIANWPDGKMAVAELDAGGRHLFLTGFPLDRDATDWPTRPSFVPFVHGAARWLAASKEERADWRVGDAIPLPDSEGKWTAIDTPLPQEEIDVHGTVRPDAPGLYEFTSGAVKKYFAVNVPIEESDLAPWPNADQIAALESTSAAPAQNRATVLPAAWAGAENQQRLWWWLLFAAGCALLAELALANRTSP